MLNLKNLSIRFGENTVISGLDLEIHSEEIAGIVGPNGCGKTTLFNLICKFYQPQSGEIYVNGHNITGLEPHAVFRLGLSRLFQQNRICAGLTIREHLMLVDDVQQAQSLWKRALCRSHPIPEEFSELLNAVGLDGYLDKTAGCMSFGQQRLLGLCLLLFQNRPFVLLDEPTAGVDPANMETILYLLEREVKGARTTLLIEHNLDVVKKLCNTVHVLEAGKILRSGNPDEILDDHEVQRILIGR